MDPGIQVPPAGYGGHERLVEIFAQEYIRLGHEVHLLVTPGSYVEGCVVHPFGKRGFPPRKKDAMLAIPEAWKFLVKNRKKFDLIHNFGRYAYLLPILYHPVKKIMTYGREISSFNVRFMNTVPGRNVVFTGCSSNLLSRIKVSGDWETVYNAIDFSKYNLREQLSENAPLIFLGRIERVKGCHTAIAVAKATGQRLIIAGNISPLPEEKAYFHEQIESQVDGQQIIYVGQLDDKAKDHFLGQSKALLFPIEWNEPFGIVMIEAMACGTPVIAFNRGSVDEVVDEGKTGFKVSNFEGMVEAISKLDQFDRKSCRIQAEKRFDVSVIARQYLGLFFAGTKRILIVTTGQPAANPRVRKEYRALFQKGYRVKVLYAYSADWSYRIDEDHFQSGKIRRHDFLLAGGSPYDHRVFWNFSRLMFRVFIWLDGVFPISFFKEMSMARAALPLLIRAKKYKADIYIAHYLGALPAAIKAARKHHARLIFDAEDFHRGEAPYFSRQIKQVTATENRLFPYVDRLTTASPLISRAYSALFPELQISTINNVFSKSNLQQPYLNKGPFMHIFWFSQIIGPNRGLEIIIKALNILRKKDIHFHMLGNVKNPEYIKSLLEIAHDPSVIHLIPPVDPADIFKVAAEFDIGMAAEIPYCENRDICLTNKIFTYLMSGNCILASDTRAQSEFLQRYPGIGLVYKHDDENSLAGCIELLYNDRDKLNAFRKNALELAEGSMNWENESAQLIEVVESLK